MELGLELGRGLGVWRVMSRGMLGNGGRQEVRAGIRGLVGGGCSGGSLGIGMRRDVCASFPFGGGLASRPMLVNRDH